MFKTLDTQLESLEKMLTQDINNYNHNYITYYDHLLEEGRTSTLIEFAHDIRCRVRALQYRIEKVEKDLNKPE